MSSFLKKKQNQIKKGYQTRTETLFDAVIAIAMTMIALEINIPDKSILDKTTWYAFGGEITIYFISFIVLASIWSVHARIYSTYSSLGNSLDIFINIILMFIITLFPILTKFMGQMHENNQLKVIYLVCYGIMIGLVNLLQYIANRENIQTQIDEFRSISEYMILFKDKFSEERSKDMVQKIDFIQNYIDDPNTFHQLYQELITTLPVNIRQELQSKKHEEKKETLTIIIFNVITFVAVFLSVLTVMINPYYCYLIILCALIVFSLIKFIILKCERRL